MERDAQIKQKTIIKAFKRSYHLILSQDEGRFFLWRYHEQVQVWKLAVKAFNRTINSKLDKDRDLFKVPFKEYTKIIK